MSHFERYEGAEDNLGHKEREWVPLEELATDRQLTPDEILMAKEETEEGVPIKLDTEGMEDEKSNWEDDVEEGEYDDFRESVEKKEIDINPIKSETRRNLSGIMDEKRKDRGERFYDYPVRNINNSKPKRPEDDGESIRFDEAV